MEILELKSDRVAVHLSITNYKVKLIFYNTAVNKEEQRALLSTQLQVVTDWQCTLRRIQDEKQDEAVCALEKTKPLR